MLMPFERSLPLERKYLVGEGILGICIRIWQQYTSVLGVLKAEKDPSLNNIQIWPFKLFPYNMGYSSQFTVTGKKSMKDGLNPFYAAYRPREKAHRLHTRRMQRRENNVQSFEKLRQVRRNLDQAKNLLEALIKREEKKRDVMESEVSLQRIQMKYKNETELLEDSLALPEMPSFHQQSKFVSSEDEYLESDDFPLNNNNNNRIRFQPHGLIDTPRVIMPSGVGSMKRDIRRRPVPYSWLHKLDPVEPVLLFTKPLVAEKLAAAGIVPPPSGGGGGGGGGHNFRGRIGRGGRIVFDRWNPLMHTPIECGGDSLLYMPPKPRSSTHNSSFQ